MLGHLGALQRSQQWCVHDDEYRWVDNYDARAEKMAKPMVSTAQQRMCVAFI
jgi:hypothetical protein